MTDATQIINEEEYATNLQRARRQTRQQTLRKTTDASSKEISLPGAFLVMLFLGILFDLPQALLGATFVGILLNIIWVPMGYGVAYLWLKLNGRSLMGGKSGNKLLRSFGISAGAELISGGILPGISGFILSVILNERAEKAMKKVGMSTGSSVAKKTG